MLRRGESVHVKDAETSPMEMIYSFLSAEEDEDGCMSEGNERVGI